MLMIFIGKGLKSLFGEITIDFALVYFFHSSKIIHARR